MNSQQFRLVVYDIVSAIPRGRVLSYSDVARLAGFPNHSRQVGRALHLAPTALDIPCHRVVNAYGHTASRWPEQKQLLEAEGVAFTRGGHVDMARSRWDILTSAD